MTGRTAWYILRPKMTGALTVNQLELDAIDCIDGVFSAVLYGLEHFED